jgi:hypothetical protein
MTHLIYITIIIIIIMVAQSCFWKHDLAVQSVNFLNNSI